MFNVIIYLYPKDNKFVEWGSNNIESYLDTNLMQRIGSTRQLNNMSEVDNDTTKGVVT